MAIKKLQKGWQVDIRPTGAGGSRIRKSFRTKREAEAFEVSERAKGNAGEWQPPTKDKRRLSDLVKDWYELHGHLLKDSTKRLAKLEGTCKRLGDPIANKFTGEHWLRHRKVRLTEKHPRKDTCISPNTVNHEHAYLSAVFGTLIKLNNWILPNPLSGIPKIKIDEPELIYLELDQIRMLMSELENSRNENVLMIASICLSTGSRWGEAESLQAHQVKKGMVHFSKTKNGKLRSVPILPELEADLLKGKDRFGPLFEGTSIAAFRQAVKRSNLHLPDGQMTHVLRHTFASHFMIQDGNILKLKDILGHQTLTMTLKYAKLAPRHLIDATTKNPLALINRPQSVASKV